ncbi:MAG: energy transducer TonB [Blastocatellia bacterium]
MFDKLVVSSQQRRNHTTAKYFFGTAGFYVLAIGCALCLSVLLSDPRLADASTVITLIGPSLPPAFGTPPKVKGPQQRTRPAARPDPRNVESLDKILSRNASAPPRVPLIDDGGDGDVGASDGPLGSGSPVGVTEGHRTLEPPPRPDLPKQRQVAQTTPVPDNRPIRVTSSVLQGKAIERQKPIYPRLAQQIRLQDQVSVEVMISPEGRVENARVVSGHPMFTQVAREAALGWRFQPTLLNSIPVRVTGVIVFVFKLSE